MSRRSDRRRELLSAAACAFAALGCSLTRPSVDECSSNAECQERFGVGMVCGGDGLCERAGDDPRCDQAYPEDLLLRPENHPSTIVFGNLMDRSIDTQIQRENAVRLAASQVDTEGGYAGQSFGVVFCDISENTEYDSLSHTQAAVETARHLVATYDVPAIIGPSSSPDTLAVFEAVKSDGVLVISPSATSTELTSADVPVTSDGNPGLLWRTAPPDSIQGLAIAKHFKQLNPKPDHVVVIYEQGAYGEALSSVFESTYATAGETVDLLEFANANERDSHVIATAQSPADTVVFVSSLTVDAADFVVLAASQAGYAQKSLFLTDSAANADFLAQAAAGGGDAIFPRVSGSRPGLGGGYTVFRGSFNAAFDVDANEYSYVAHAYDAAWLVFLGSVWALEQEPALDGRGVARGLRRLRGGSTAFQIEPLNWKPMTEALAGGSPLDVEGASGPLDFDSVTEEPSAPIEIWGIAADGQSIVTLSTIE